MRTEAQEELRFSELRYRRIFETARDGILIVDAATGRVTKANPFLKEMLGYSPAEIVGKELWQIGVFKDTESSQAMFLELKNKGYVRYKDMPLETKDGRVITVDCIGNAYLVGNQHVIQCNLRDVTDQRRVEKLAALRALKLEELNQSQEKTKMAMLNIMEDLGEARAVIEIERARDEAMLACIGDGVIAVDIHQKILIINTSAEKMLGWKVRDVLGKEITTLPIEDEDGSLVRPEQRPTHIALTTGKTVTAHYFFIRKDATRFPIAIHVTPIKLGGNIIGAIDIFRDITHEKEIDRAKSEFISLASHQLRTPLGIAKWYLEALEYEEYFQKAPLSIRKYFDEICKSNERVLSIVRDLLSVSRIDQGNVKDAPQPTDIVREIRESVEHMRVMADTKKITLDVTIHDRTIPSLNIDILRFHEVLENLIGNAIQYTPSMGSVWVTVHTQGKTLRIRIQDSGIGISPRDQEKLFTKFFRSEKAIAYNPEGSGLGLYIAKSYVEGWGGTVLVESLEGNGSTFVISIPSSAHKKRPEKRKGERL